MSTLIGFTVVDFLIYLRYDMHTFYKEWKNKTKEEKTAENKRKIKASKAAFLVFGPFFVLATIRYLEIRISDVFGFLLMDLIIVGVSAYCVLYYKIDKNKK